MTPAPQSSPESDLLSPVERLIALVIGLGAAIGAWQLMFHPPSITQASSSCLSTACVVKVSATDQTAVVALIALAAAAGLVAVLGVRFTKLSAAGASLEQATVREVDPKKAAEHTAGALTDNGPRALEPRVAGPPSAPLSEYDQPAPSAVARPVPQAETAAAPRLASAPAPDDQWNELPWWAQDALVAWAEGVDAVTRPMRFAVIEAAKEAGQGNRPWYVKVRLDDSTVRTLRVATGRGGTTATEHA